jgi:hypothetical protein
MVTAVIVGAGAAVLPLAPAQAAEPPAPTAHYDMSHTGTALTDVSGNGRDATLVNFTDASFLDVSDEDVLRFRGNGYASLPMGLVTGTDNDFAVEFTVSTQTAANHFGWVIGNGVGAWNTTALGNHVFVSPRSAQSGYANKELAGIRVKDTGNGETRLPAPATNAGSGFTTLTLTSSGNTLTLYRDGVQISTVAHTKSMSAIVPTTGSVLGYLGRSLYTGDALLTGDVADVKFWDTTLTADQVVASMPTAAEKAALTSDVLETDILPALLASNTSVDDVRSNLSFPASVDGVPLTWTSSNTAVVGPNGSVSRPSADTAVTITATSATEQFVFTITVKALGESELGAAVQADLDAIVLKERTTENLPLAATGRVNGSAISWASSDPELVTATDAGYEAPAVGAADPFAGAGVVARPAYGEGDEVVTLTARASRGSVTLEKSFEITVAEKGRTAPDAGYASAYFKADNDERIYEAATTKNDFFSFTPVNGGAAVITSTTDTKGLRDPYILRSHDGDKYYMIATDLCIGTTSNGCSTSWGDSQSKGSLKVEVWESTDLVTWDRTNGANSGITVNQPEAGMTWAPEAYWDDDLQSYVVFFSSRLYSDASHTSSDNQSARLFYVLTRDFTTFTYPPVEWQYTGFARIDSTVTKIDDYYYRFSKNEEGGAADGLEVGKDIFLERSKVLTAKTTASSAATDPATGWQLIDTNMTRSETGQNGEGPEIVKLNAGDPSNTPDDDGYVFLVDNYGSGGYVPFVTTGSAIASSTMDSRLSRSEAWAPRAKTGLPASPRHGAFVNVPQTVLDAMHGWTGIEAVGSTTTATLDGRTVTATVNAEDGGDVAGDVTFRKGSWSQTAHLIGGTASVELPPSVMGTVSVSYDGYADELVDLSETTVRVATQAFASAPTPTVSGVTKVGARLVADAGEWTPAPTSLWYQWFRSGAPIAAANSSSYVLTEADAGATITVAVTGSRSQFAAQTVTSAATAPVAQGDLSAPVPTVSGTEKVGSTLKVRAGEWTPAPVALSYEWLRDGTPIAGATAARYTLVAADKGASVAVRVTGERDGYATISATSVAQEVSPGTLSLSKPKIAGSEKIGKKLTAKIRSGDESGVTLKYRWYRSGKAISGASASTYTLKGADEGKKITVKVTAKKDGYTKVGKTSKPTKKVR